MYRFQKLDDMEPEARFAKSYDVSKCSCSKRLTKWVLRLGVSTSR